MMLADFDKYGTLVIEPESNTEKMALDLWLARNILDVKLDNHNENFIIKGSALVVDHSRFVSVPQSSSDQSLITEYGKNALRELMLQAINEWEVSTADCKEDAINQILESK
jgi:hypothetical protein